MQPDVLTALHHEREPDTARAAAGAAGAPWRRVSEALDAALRALAEPVLGPGQAILATGSYGRREQPRHADIDVLLLASGDASEAVHTLLAPLWDAGVRVRYAVRPPHRPAGPREPLEDLIGLLDARLVCGDQAAFAEFGVARRALVRRSRGPLRAELRRRHAVARAAEPWQVVEPDIVTGRGGLDTFLAVHWTALAEAIAEDRHLPALADPEIPLAAEYDLIMRTLTALRALRDQRDDRLRRSDATAVAALLGSDEVAATRGLLLAMRTVDRVATETLDVSDGLTARLLRLTRRLPGVTPAPQPELDGPRQLLRTLRSPSAAALEPLPSAPWLDRLLPEWETVRGWPRAEPAHDYPVDTHLLRTVREALRAVTEDADSTSTPIVAAELADPDELLLVALLHDIGEGHEGDHSRAGAVIAERFAARAGFDAEASRRVVTVVEQHRLLATVATRRDLAEERVIGDVAAAVGDPATLHLLYLLAVADARATGADAWNTWRAAQLRTLYARVLQYMTGETSDPRTVIQRRHDAVIDALASRFGSQTVEAHLGQLPPRYLLAMAPETIRDHLTMIAEAAGGTVVRHDPVGDFERLTIVTPDRPGILSLVAGTLAVHQVSVLGGNAYTREDGVAIQVLHVTDPSGVPIDDQRWVWICAALPVALAGNFPVARLLLETRASHVRPPGAGIPTTVYVDNTDSDRYSIVEVRAGDRLGLLFAITHALHESGLDIHLAKVDTIGHEVADAFYVLRRNGRRVEAPDEIERIRQHVLEQIAALDG